jgi:hypothetical protein
MAQILAFIGLSIFILGTFGWSMPEKKINQLTVLLPIVQQ